jgi:hypothetical protein
MIANKAGRTNLKRPTVSSAARCDHHNVGRFSVCKGDSMAKRMDATIKSYGPGMGYCMTLANGSEYEADTVKEAMTFARDEGATRVYSAAKPSAYVLLCREDA